MTEEEILKLIKGYFTEEWCEEDGWGWTEFSGNPDAFVKFAEAIHKHSFSLGYYAGIENAGEFGQDDYYMIGRKHGFEERDRFYNGYCD